MRMRSKCKDKKGISSYFFYISLTSLENCSHSTIDCTNILHLVR